MDSWGPSTLCCRSSYTKKGRYTHPLTRKQHALMCSEIHHTSTNNLQPHMFLQREMLSYLSRYHFQHTPWQFQMNHRYDWIWGRFFSSSVSPDQCYIRSVGSTERNLHNNLCNSEVKHVITCTMLINFSSRHHSKREGQQFEEKHLPKGFKG